MRDRKRPFRSLVFATHTPGEGRAQRFQALLFLASLIALRAATPAVAAVDEPPLVIITAAAVGELLLSGSSVREGKYLDLVPYSECNHGFLESPLVRFDAQRLRLQLHFSGRTGTELAGQCLGPSFTSDVIATATLSVAADAIVLSEIEIRIPDAGAFETLIRQQLQGLVPSSQRIAFLPLLKTTAENGTALPHVAPETLVLTSLKTTSGELAVYGHLTLRVGTP